MRPKYIQALVITAILKSNVKDQDELTHWLLSKDEGTKLEVLFLKEGGCSDEDIYGGDDVSLAQEECGSLWDQSTLSKNLKRLAKADLITITGIRKGASKIIEFEITKDNFKTISIKLCKEMAEIELATI